MWKYVGNRIKDSTELCTHLKNLRSTFSTCEAKAKAKTDSPKQERFRCFDLRNNGRAFNVWECFDSSIKQNKQQKQRKEANVDTTYYVEEYNQKQKQKQQEAFHNCCDVNFLQWVSHTHFFIV